MKKFAPICAKKVIDNSKQDFSNGKHYTDIKKLILFPKNCGGWGILAEERNSFWAKLDKKSQLHNKSNKKLCKKPVPGWVGGWMGWGKSHFKDWLHQSKSFIIIMSMQIGDIMWWYRFQNGDIMWWYGFQHKMAFIWLKISEIIVQ